MLLQPREYQDFAIDRAFDYFNDKSGNQLILMPTGTGKSIVVAGICVRAMHWYPQTRIIMLTKTKELVQQNYEKLKLCWSDAPVGVYCDGLNRKQHHYPITFGTIGSVVNCASLFGFVDFIIVDEAHEIGPSDDTMYRKFVAECAKINPQVKVIGLTATGYRMKQGKLTDGENALFTDVSVDMTGLDAFNWFFHEGYLVPPIPRPTQTSKLYDLSKIAIRGGEYDQKQLQEEVDNTAKNEAAILELLEFGQTRHSGLIFASGLTHCKHLVDILHYYGQDATWVASKGMTEKERDRNIAAYKDNQFKWMVNNGILTTGFDKTDLDLIGMLQHTLSTAKWVQMLGRGTRPHYEPGFDLSTRDGRLASIAASQKRNCMVLDFAENVTRLGPINDPRVPEPKERKRAGDAPIRICDGCGCYNHASAAQCWNCGFVFPRYLKLQETSGTKELVKKFNAPPANAPTAEQLNVDRVEYKIWKKPEKPDSICVTYICGRKTFREWVCLEHEGIAEKKARAWWKSRVERTDLELGQEIEIPTSTEEALAVIDSLPQPRAIKVIVEGNFGDVRGYVF